MCSSYLEWCLRFFLDFEAIVQTQTSRIATQSKTPKRDLNMETIALWSIVQNFYANLGTALLVKPN